MTKKAAEPITPARTIKVTETDRIYTLKIGPGCKLTFGPSIPARPKIDPTQRVEWGNEFAGQRPMEYALRIYGPGGKDDLVGVYTGVREVQVMELIERVKD